MATKNEDGFDKLTNSEIKWMMHHNELKEYVAVHHHNTKMFIFNLKIL